MTAAPVVALTCSFRGDLGLCRLLCQTMDRVDPGLTHRIVVPRRDLPLFADLTRPGRTLVAAEDFLPAGTRVLPIPRGRWRRWVGLSHRDVFLLKGGGRSNGWIVQQVVKLAAAMAAPEPIVVHVDSDAVLVRPLTGRLSSARGVRLYANPAIGPREPHGAWHLAAAQLLGLPETRWFGAGYIDQIVVWRSDTVRALGARLEADCGTDWRARLLRTPAFAEYILYGVFCEHVLGAAASGHEATDQSLALTCWTGEAAGDDDAIIARLTPGHAGFCIQSTLPVPMARRMELAARLIARAAEQDEQGRGATQGPPGGGVLEAAPSGGGVDPACRRVVSR